MYVYKIDIFKFCDDFDKYSWLNLVNSVKTKKNCPNNQVLQQTFVLGWRTWLCLAWADHPHFFLGRPTWTSERVESERVGSLCSSSPQPYFSHHQMQLTQQSVAKIQARDFLQIILKAEQAIWEVSGLQLTVVGLKTILSGQTCARLQTSGHIAHFQTLQS